MKRFDKRYMGGIERLPFERRREAYLHYLSFKTGIFSREPNLLIGALVIAAFSLLFALNDLAVGAAILVLFLGLALESILLTPYISKKQRELESLEDGFLGGYIPPSEPRPQGEDVAKATYGLLDYYSYRGYVYILLELVLSMAVCLINGRPELNYLLFTFMSLYFLNYQGRKLADSLFQGDSHKKEEAYFIGTFLGSGEI